MRPMLPVFTLTALFACLTPLQARAQVTFAAPAPALPAGHRTELTVDGRPLTGDLVRATADGLVLWRYDTGAPIRSSAALGAGPDGQPGAIVYYGAGNG